MRVFVIDDSPSVVATLRRVVEAIKGSEVLSFLHPSDALRRLDDQTPDLILVDYTMPSAPSGHTRPLGRSPTPFARSSIATAPFDPACVAAFCRRRTDIKALFESQNSDDDATSISTLQLSRGSA